MNPFAMYAMPQMMNARGMMYPMFMPMQFPQQPPSTNTAPASASASAPPPGSQAPSPNPTTQPAPSSNPTSAAQASTIPPPVYPPFVFANPWMPYGNPYMFNPMMGMYRPNPMAAQGSFPTAPQTVPQAAPTMDPKVLYATQLDKMKEMGFFNEEVNLDALKATNGNIDSAIERILNMLK